MRLFDESFLLCVNDCVQKINSHLNDYGFFLVRSKPKSPPTGKSRTYDQSSTHDNRREQKRALDFVPNIHS